MFIIVQAIYNNKTNICIFLTQKHEKHYAHVYGWAKQANKPLVQFEPGCGKDHKIGVLI